MKRLKKYFFTHLTCLILVFYFFNLELFSFTKVELEQQYLQFFKEAEKYRTKGKFLKSIELMEKSLNTAKKISNERKECESYFKIGLLYWNIGRLKESSAHYENALSLAQKLNLKHSQEECRNALEIYRLYQEGKMFRSSGEYHKSIESFKNAINIAREIGSKEHEVKCLRQQSSTHLRLNDMQEFFLKNWDALNLARSINHRIEEGRCLNNIGIFYWKLDNYSKALSCYEEALKIARNLENKREERACLNNIGIIYKDIGNYDKALEYLTKNLTIEKLLLRDDVFSLNNIGETYRTKGLISNNKEDFNKALEYFNACLKLTRKTRDKKEVYIFEKAEVYALNNIGNVHSDLKKHTEALKYFRSAYEKANEIQDIEAIGMLLNNMGIVHFNLGNYVKSTEYYEEAIKLANEIKSNQILWEAFLEMANAYAKQNNLNKALENYKESIRTIENIRSTIDLEELKARYLGTDKRIEAYHNLIHILVTFHQANPEKAYDREAFHYLERAKARAFLDSLELSQVNISRGVDFKLINQEKELMKDITNIYTKLLAAELSPEEKNAIKEQLNRKEDELVSLKREIRSLSPAYANLKYPEIITLDKAQKELLDSKTAFFEYCIGKDFSYAFVITKNDLKIFPIPSRETLHQQVSDYIKLINDKENKNFKPGFELFRTLVFPGLDKKIKNIILIPDDILHIFPFETLITHKDSKEWLIKDYKIAYAPSMSSLWEILHRKNSNSEKTRMDILAFGDPSFGYLETEDNREDIFQEFFSSGVFNFFRLKYSGFEIERISSLFKKTKRNIFRRDEASEEKLKQYNLTEDLADYKIIHFATHSIIDDKKPARSSIVLRLDEDPTEDGFFQVREIYNMKLNADLVTLSSCQTGLGEFIRGEGVEGLNRAFFYAGTSAVIVSLWAINDQASCQLMERFYHHLQSSQSIMNALRKAKLEIINSDILSHPYYWAGFVVTGKADEIIFPQSMNRWFILVAFLLLGGFILIVKVIKKKT